MKDGRTHLAHKAEHAADLETGAVVGVTVQAADTGDTTSMIETLIMAAEQLEAVQPDGAGLEEVVGDKGYHSNRTLTDLKALGLRSYISEPDRGRRCWRGRSKARDAVYATGGGFAASGAVGCCAVGENCWSVHSRTCARPAGCGGSIFESTRTSSSGYSCSSPAATTRGACGSTQRSSGTASVHVAYIADVEQHRQMRQNVTDSSQPGREPLP